MSVLRKRKPLAIIPESNLPAIFLIGIHRKMLRQWKMPALEFPFPRLWQLRPSRLPGNHGRHHGKNRPGGGWTIPDLYQKRP